MGSYMQPRANLGGISRQPFRPGQWQGFRGVSKNTTYIQNNFYGSSIFGANRNFGYAQPTCDGSCQDGNDMPKWMKWMVGIGTGASLLGGILKLFSKDKTDKANDTQNVDKKTETDSKTSSETKDSANTDNTDSTDSTDNIDNTNKTDKTGSTVKTKSADTPEVKTKTSSQDNLKVEKQEVKSSTNYKVQYGDTWANIITAKYKDENGNSISYSDAKELWTQLKNECGVSKSADGMPSDIELPNEFKGYKLDINASGPKNSSFKTENYKDYDGSNFKPKTSTNYKATGSINGQSIGEIHGSGTEVTAELRKKGFSDTDIKNAIQNGEVKISKPKEE